MTELSGIDASAMVPPSAGALLRHARQAQGLHIAALAAALKVSPRKLEALENEQFSELPDVAFARALAQAVCRHLKIDAPPVLALLPAAATEQPGLERVTNGLNTPFREHAQRHEQGEWPSWLQPQLILPALLVLAALAFLFLPKSWVPAWFAGPVLAPASQASPPPVDAARPPALVLPPAAASAVTSQAESTESSASGRADAALPPEVVLSHPSTEQAEESAPVASMPVPAGVLVLRASSESWIEVVDGRGDVLISRLLARGESVGLNGSSPLHLRIGNAEGMQIRFKGRTVPLHVARDNTARVVLK